MVFPDKASWRRFQVYMCGGKESLGSVHVSSAKSGSMLGFYISKFLLYSYPSPPAGQLSRTIETSSKLLSRLDHFALEDSIANEVLAVLRLDSGQPYALCGLIQRLAVGGQASSVNQDICRVFVAADVIDKVNSNASRTFVVKVTGQAQRSQVSLKLFLE